MSNEDKSVAGLIARMIDKEAIVITWAGREMLFRKNPKSTDNNYQEKWVAEFYGYTIDHLAEYLATVTILGDYLATDYPHRTNNIEGVKKLTHEIYQHFSTHCFDDGIFLLSVDGSIYRTEEATRMWRRIFAHYISLCEAASILEQQVEHQKELGRVSFIAEDGAHIKFCDKTLEEDSRTSIIVYDSEIYVMFDLHMLGTSSYIKNILEIERPYVRIWDNKNDDYDYGSFEATEHK